MLCKCQALIENESASRSKIREKLGDRLTRLSAEKKSVVAQIKDLEQKHMRLEVEIGTVNQILWAFHCDFERSDDR